MGHTICLVISGQTQAETATTISLRGAAEKPQAVPVSWVLVFVSVRA